LGFGFALAQSFVNVRLIAVRRIVLLEALMKRQRGSPWISWRMTARYEAGRYDLFAELAEFSQTLA
jgi:hypothetical protein